jgi:Coenzyme PQQ synthesis protein D (PqqD)
LVESTSKSFAKGHEFVTRCISGETIIVPIRKSVGELDAIYTLNEVGGAIWQLIDGTRTVEEIAAVICDEYDVSPEEAAKDVLDLLMSLEAQGLIRGA